MNSARISVMLRGSLKPSALAAALVVGMIVDSAQALTTSQTFNLGTSPASTNFPSTGINSLVVWIPKGSLPAGSILRSVTATDLKLETQLGNSWASNLGVFLDPTPETPGGPGGLLKIGDDNNYGGADQEMGWNGAQGDGPFTVSRSDSDWPTPIDLSTVAVMLGNGYAADTAYSGTITVVYDVPEMAAIKTFGPGAVVGPLVGNAASISWTVPSGTNVTALAPTFTLSSGTCDRDNGGPTTYDFTNPVVYTVTDGATVNTYTVTVTVATAVVWNVAGGGAWDTSTSNWLGQISGLPTTFANGNEVIFSNTAGGAIAITADMSPFSTTVNAASGTYTFSGGPIATGSLIKSGGGNLTITTANNTYGGGTVINAGQLKMDVLANAALGTGPVTLNGGRLFLERITASNALIVNGGNIWPDNGFGNNWNGPVTLNANLVIQGPNYATTTFNGTISGSGGLTLNGQGPLVLAVANSYTGPTSVSGCTLRCNHVDALGSGVLSISSAANSKVNLNYSGTKNIAGLILGGVEQPSGTHGSVASGAVHKSDTYFTPGSTGTVTVPASSSKNVLTFSFGALGAATVHDTTITLEVPFGTDRSALAPTYTVSPGASGSPVSGTALNFNGPQIYTITAEDLSTKQYTVTVTEAALPDVFTWTNAATGNWSVAANWTNELATGSAPLASGRPSYTINFTAPGTYTATNNLSLSGFQLNQLNLGANVTLGGNPLAFTANNTTLPTINQNSGSAVTIDNNLDLGSNTTFGGSGLGQVTLNGFISGAGSFTKNGSSMLVIKKVNTYGGGTIIQNGTLRVDYPGDGLPSYTSLGSGTVTLDGGQLRLNRAILANALTVNGGTFYFDNGFANTWSGPITINASLMNLTTQYSNSHHISGAISGTGGITLTSLNGGGMRLSGTNTYAGPTTVTGGTLRCDSPAAVAGGDWLITGGKLNPNYSGTKTVASLTLGGVQQTTPGTYGSVASGANFPSDTYFTAGSTGTLTLAATGSDYNTWLGNFTFAPGADTTPTGDPDGDGRINREEYAFGLNPTLASSVNPIVSPLNPSTGIFQYTRRATPANTGIAYTVLSSGSLTGWTAGGATETGTTTAGDIETVTVHVTALPVDGKLFVRVQAVLPP